VKFNIKFLKQISQYKQDRIGHKLDLTRLISELASKLLIFYKERLMI